MRKLAKVQRVTFELAKCFAVLLSLTSGSAGASESRARVLLRAEALAKWQLGHLTSRQPSSPSDGSSDPRGWAQSVYWVGMTALAEQSSKPWVRSAILAQGRANQWKLGSRLYHADDQVIGQIYLWAATHSAAGKAIVPLRSNLDRILADPPRVDLEFLSTDESDSIKCMKRWCWSDALFMGPATWLGLSRQTGDRRYHDYALSEFWATTNFLYDPSERLYFRDSRFFALRDANGRRVFWSRGNGWVFAGLVRMMESLPPNDPDRRRLQDLFQEMARRVKELQKADGYWPPALLAPEGSSPESSGTALFTYGLAWGIEHGLLERAEYEAAVRRGWSALERAIQPDGRLGWVQQVGDRPDEVAATDTDIYGVGAFLLAAAAVVALDLRR